MHQDRWAAQRRAALHFAILKACLGGMVIHRAVHNDSSYALISTFAALLFTRALWLGNPWAVPLKQLWSGALLLFTLFMISDPKMTPDSRLGQILFTVLIALGAASV